MTSTSLQKGGNLSLTRLFPESAEFYVALGWSPSGHAAGMEVDTSAFVLAANGKVREDEDFVFYNNPRSPKGFVELLKHAEVAGGEDAQVFRVDLAASPREAERIAFAVTIHEGQARRQHFGVLNSAWARVVEPSSRTELVRFELPLGESTETAMIFCEIYRRGGEWKFRAIGQGYAGGLEPMARDYGVDVAEESAAPAGPSAPSVPPPAAPSAAPPPAASAPPTEPAPEPAGEHQVRLEKRVVQLEKRDPGLVSLVKKAGTQLAQYGLQYHQAKVALCLDISGSMHGLYRKGSIDTLVRRVLALGFRFDDDGEIDVFLFGKGAYYAGVVTADNYQTFVKKMLKQYPLEGGTAYGAVMKLVREHYRNGAVSEKLPVYVMFATDGDTSDRSQSEQQIKEASQEPIFWQFMAIGTPPEERKGFFSRLLGADFQFLQHLDTMRNRFIDNANFFLVRDPAEPSDEELIALMMAEYPAWLTAARVKGLLR